jgi:hypothetical protein
MIGFHRLSAMEQLWGKPHRPQTAVLVNCPTADGLISGQGTVLRVIDKDVCGANWAEQFIYLVRMGDALKVIPAEYLKPTECAK